MAGSYFAPAPRAPPRGTAHGRAGRAAGTQVGTGAVPELPKTPLGLLGLVVVAGGSGTARYWAVWAWGGVDWVGFWETRWVVVGGRRSLKAVLRRRRRTVEDTDSEGEEGG